MRFEPEPGIPCPRCQRTAGREDRVTGREGNQVRVIVRCEVCRHRWSVMVPLTEYSGRPKPD